MHDVENVPLEHLLQEIKESVEEVGRKRSHCYKSRMNWHSAKPRLPRTCYRIRRRPRSWVKTKPTWRVNAPH